MVVLPDAALLVGDRHDPGAAARPSASARRSTVVGSVGGLVSLVSEASRLTSVVADTAGSRRRAARRPIVRRGTRGRIGRTCRTSGRRPRPRCSTWNDLRRPASFHVKHSARVRTAAGRERRRRERVAGSVRLSTASQAAASIGRRPPSRLGRAASRAASDSVGAGGSLTTSRPPTRSGAAHSAVTAGRPKLRADDHVERARAAGSATEHLGPLGTRPRPDRRAPSAPTARRSSRRGVALASSSATIEVRPIASASTRPGRPPPLPRSSTVSRRRDGARSAKPTGVVDVRRQRPIPDPSTPRRWASAEHGERAAASGQSVVRAG